MRNWTRWIVGIAIVLSPPSSGDLNAADCNGNGVDDVEDVASGNSADCNSNRIPDECEQSFLRLGRNDADSYSLRDMAIFVLAEDIDGDRRLDLITGNVRSTNATISVLRHRPDGGFESPVNYPAGAGMGSLAAADLDGDGRIDLVVAGTSSISVLYNEGAGEFSAPRSIAMDRSPSTVVVTDLNGDGRADIAVTNRVLDRVSILSNRGEREFADPVHVTVGDNPIPLVAGDLDADGDPDLLVGNRSDSSLTFLENDGQGNLVPTRETALPDRPLDLANGDFDGDGRTDLAVRGASDVSFLSGLGDGAFRPTGRFMIRARHLQAADMDNDGDTDIALTVGNSNSVAVLLNNGQGQFTAHEEFGLGAAPRNLVPADLDADGDLDLAVAAGPPDEIVVLANGEPGRNLAVDSATYGFGRPPHAAAMADLDGDGDQDVVTGDGGNRTVTVMLNDGTGAYSIKSQRNSGAYINSVSTGDLDADGDIDLAIVDRQGNRLLVILNEDGNASFINARSVSAGASPFFVTNTDLDGDGLPDLVSANESANSISVVLNAGGGSFEGARHVRVGSRPVAIAPADLDGDGDTDLAVANHRSREVSVLLNDGAGAFSGGTLLLSEGQPIYVVAGDWDRDGHPDLATANSPDNATTASGELGVFRNRGDGTFEAVRLVRELQPPYSLAVGDYDGDGFPDIIAANRWDNTVSVNLNRGDGSFSMLVSYRVGGEPRFAPVGDVDGDLDIDIVAANHDTNDITVLLSDSPPRSDEPYLERICTVTEMRAIGVATRRNGIGIKYLTPARPDLALLPTLFQNTRLFALHNEFLAVVFPDRFPIFTPEDLERVALRRATRDYYIGSIELVPTPRGTVHAFTVVTGAGPQEALTVEEIEVVHQNLASSFELRPLAYMPDTALARERAESWRDPPFLLFLGETPSSTYEPYTRAVGYGRIRRFTARQFDEANSRGRFTFQDIVVIENAPRDIEGVVGGVITGAVQDTGSHIAVRTARRGTPNAFVANALEEFGRHEGRLVRLEVGAEHFTVEEASLREAEEFWASSRPRLPDLPPVDLEYSGLDGFEDMDFTGTTSPFSRFGGKASNLARLQTILDGEWAGYRERGFAIPVKYYFDFMRSNTLPSVADPSVEVTYQEYLEELFALPDFRTNSEFRFQALGGFRRYARDFGRVSPDLVTALGARIEEVFASRLMTVRFRSSSNVEDLLDFNGAGLYESTSVCVADTLDGDDAGPSLCDPTKSGERSIPRALKKVWTSLWTFRAHEERSFFQVPQSSAAMGILVNRAFLDERANGVAFTGDFTNPREGSYVVSAQVGEESVVSPDPDVSAERSVLDVVDGEVVQILRARTSSLVPAGEFVLSDPELEELGALLWHIEHHFPVDTEGHDRRDILFDVEFKIEAGGELAVKQVRPFLFTGEREPSPTFELRIPPGTVVCGVLDRDAPRENPRSQYESKSRIRFREGVYTLPTRSRVLSADLIEEVLVGPGREPALADGPGTLRVRSRTDPASERTIHTFDYEQTFTLANGRLFVVDILGLEYQAEGDTPVTPELVLNEEYLTYELTMQGVVDDPFLGVAYSSCTYELLPAWDVIFELEGRDRVALRERFEPPEIVTLTGPASLERASITLGDSTRRVESYWDLVYASGRHNTFVRYWVILNPPVEVTGLEEPVHALELAAPVDFPGLPDSRPAKVTYLDAALEALASAEVRSHDRFEAADPPTPRFLRGDGSADGIIDLTDVVQTMEFLFLSGGMPPCPKAADANDDGRLNILDPIATLLHVFRARALPAPAGACGEDPTADDLGCDPAGPCPS